MSPRSRASKNGYSQFPCEYPPSCKSPRSLDRTVTNHAGREGVLLSSHLRLSDSTLSPPAAQTVVWLSHVSNGQLSCLPPAPPSPQGSGTCLVMPAPSHPQTKLSLALACSRAYSVSAATRPRHWPGPTQPFCHLPPSPAQLSCIPVTSATSRPPSCFCADSPTTWRLSSLHPLKPCISPGLFSICQLYKACSDPLPHPRAVLWVPTDDLTPSRLWSWVLFCC